MKAVFDRKALAETVARVAPLAQSSRVKPILRNVLVEVLDNGQAIFSATNLEQALRVELSTRDGSQSGKCLVSADTFSAILKSCLGDEFEISATDNGVSMTCGNGRWRLNAEDVSEFPVADFGAAGGCEVPASAFVKTLGIASVCTDPNSSRFALGGVKLLAKDAVLTAIGTDGRRASIVSVPCGAQNFEALLPIAAVRLIERSLLPAGDAILNGDGNVFRVYGTGCAIWTRQLEGEFPSLDRQLESFKSQLAAQIPATALLAALQQAVVTIKDDDPTVELQFADGTLSITGEASIGEAVAQIPISYTGTQARWRVRPAYLREFLRVIGDVELTFALCVGGGGVYPDGWAMVSTDSVKYIVGGLADK